MVLNFCRIRIIMYAYVYNPCEKSKSVERLRRKAKGPFKWQPATERSLGNEIL